MRQRLVLVHTHTRSSGIGIAHQRWGPMVADRAMIELGMITQEIAMNNARIDALRLSQGLRDAADKDIDTVFVFDVGVGDAMALDGNESSAKNATSTTPRIMCGQLSMFLRQLEFWRPGFETRSIVLWNDAVYRRTAHVTRHVGRACDAWIGFGDVVAVESVHTLNVDAKSNLAVSDAVARIVFEAVRRVSLPR